MQRTWQTLLLFGLVFAAYWPSLHGLFIWDDVTFISDNDLVRSPNGLFNIWFTKDSTDYWPLTYSLLWAMWRLFGAETFGYHALNVFVHACNAFLVWRILARLGVKWAYAVALVFALHPVAVESVAWIFQVKTTLAVFLALLSFWFFIDGRRWAYWMSLALFACALLAKTSVVTWPFVMLGYVLWKKRSWYSTLPFFGLSLVSGLLGLFWYSYDLLQGAERVRVETFAERAASAGLAFWFYLGKLIVPYPLMFMYPRWTVAGIVDYLPAVSLVVVAVLLAWRGRRSMVALAFAFFLVTIFPVLGFVDIYYMRFSFVADHWQYLSMIGAIALVVGWLGSRAGALVYILVPVLFALTYRQASLYIDEETIWRDTLAKNPHAWLAENGLGLILMQSGKTEEAETHFQNVVVEKPDYVDPYINLGAIRLGRNDDAGASQYFLKALDVFPGNARALNNMAALALRHGEPEIAVHYLEDAVRFLPTYAMGYKNLGIVFLRLDEKEKAVDAFRSALKFRSDDAEAKAYLASLLTQ